MVNAGLRYTLNFPSTEAENRGAIFNLSSQQLNYLGVNGYPETARELHGGNFGHVSAGDPRVIQFALKVNF